LAEDIAKATAPPGPPDVARDAEMKTIHGNPTATAFDQIGVTGLKAFSGYVLEEYLPELMGQKALKAYKTMGDDPIVTALLTAITLILRAVDWRVEPADDGSDHRNAHSAKAEQEAEFAQGLLDDMSHPWEDVINETLSMLQFGWAYLEIILKTRLGPDQDDPAKRSKFNDGRIGIRKLPIRAQESLLRWQLQEDGGVEGMWQQPPQGGQQLFIPIERALLFRTTSKKNSPEGVSILRAAYRPWYVKRGVEDHEAIGIERELAGLPVVSIPKRYLEPGASGEDLAFAETARRLARDIKLNSQAGVVIPSEPFKNPDGTFSSVPMVKLELLSSGGSKRAIDTDIVVKRYNRLIAMSAMADFITLGDEKGSYSLSQNKSELFLRSCESYLNQIAAVVNRFLFPRIFAYNGIDPALIPVLKPGRLAPVDLNELGTYVAQLAAAGAPLFPNQELSNYLADVAGLPEPPEDIGLQPPPGKLPRFGQINPDTGEPMTLDEHAQYQQADLGGTTFGENASVHSNTMAKYNENHDEAGRFSSGGGGGGGKKTFSQKEIAASYKTNTLLARPMFATLSFGEYDRYQAHNYALRAISADPQNGREMAIAMINPGFEENAAARYDDPNEKQYRAINDKAFQAYSNWKNSTKKYNENHDELGRFAESGYTYTEGKGPLGRGKWQAHHAESGLTSYNLHPTKEQAAADLSSRLDANARRDTARSERASRLSDMRDRHLAGGEVTESDVKTLGLKAHADMRDFIPAAAELHGVSSRSIRPALGDTKIRVTYSDGGTKLEGLNSREGLSNIAASFKNLGHLKKYNENHDELGRFAESGGGALSGRQLAEQRNAHLKDPAYMTNAQLKNEHAKLGEKQSELNSKLIEAGRGSEKFNETAAKTDPLAVAYHANSLRRSALRQEVMVRYGPSLSIEHLRAGGARLKKTFELAKYNENHDELGRFAEGPGTGGQAKALYDKTLERGVTPEHIYDRVGHGAQDAAKKIEATMATRAPSDAPVEQGGFKNADGTYTADRQALHDKLLADKFTPQAIDAATPGPGERPTMTMLGGRGGSGKSFLTGPNGPVEKGTMVLNSDDFKGPLAEASGLDHRYAALYHEESDHVLKMASQRAKDLGLNVAFDSTMKSEAIAAGRMQEYKDAGYDVNGHYVHTAPQFAAERSVHRFYRGGSANGRFVPPHVILGNTKNEANFDKLSPNFQSWTLWDNNGTKPVLVARGGK
jgi:predicted ABC-type ATPase